MMTFYHFFLSFLGNDRLDPLVSHAQFPVSEDVEQDATSELKGSDPSFCLAVVIEQSL